MHPLWRPVQCRVAVSMSCVVSRVNSLHSGQDGRHLTDDSLECIFMYKNVCISIEISLKFIPDGPVLVQIIAWRRLRDKQLAEPLMIISLTHIGLTLPQ